MKITIDIDCTPEEARAALGLPDVTALNDAVIEQMKTRVEKGFSGEELDSMVRAWSESAATGMGQLQKSFWAMMQQGAAGPKRGQD